MSIEDLKAGQASSQTSPLLYLALLLPFLSFLVPYSGLSEGAPRMTKGQAGSQSYYETWTYTLNLAGSEAVLVRPGVYRSPGETGEGHAFVLVAWSGQQGMSRYTEYPLSSVRHFETPSGWVLQVGEHAAFTEHGFTLDEEMISGLGRIGMQGQVMMMDVTPFSPSILSPTVMGPWAYGPSDRSHALLAGTGEVTGWVRDLNPEGWLPGRNKSLPEGSTLSLTKAWGTRLADHGISLTISSIHSSPGAFLMVRGKGRRNCVTTCP